MSGPDKMSKDDQHFDACEVKTSLHGSRAACAGECDTSVVGDEDGLLAGEAAVGIAAGNLSRRVAQHACRLDAVLLLKHVHQSNLHMPRPCGNLMEQSNGGGPKGFLLIAPRVLRDGLNPKHMSEVLLFAIPGHSRA